MPETEHPRRPATGTELVWPVLVVALAGLIMHPEITRLAAGAPVEEWLADITLGALLLLFYFGAKFASRMEDDRSSGGEFGPSDWAVLLLSGLWVVVGVVLIAVGFSSIGVIGYTVSGAIGVAGMSYRFFEVRGSAADGSR